MMIEALYTQIYAIIESSSIILSFPTKGYMLNYYFFLVEEFYSECYPLRKSIFWPLSSESVMKML